MIQDIRNTPTYNECADLFNTLRLVGTGRVCDAAELSVSSGGRFAIFAGTVFERAEGSPPTRLCLLDLETSELKIITKGPSNDRSPCFAPDRDVVAFLSDIDLRGEFQLKILDVQTGAIESTPSVEGFVEYIRWSPDGASILLGVASFGADLSSGQGAITRQRVANDISPWMPKVHSHDDGGQWRHVWIYDCTSKSIRRLPTKENIWEASWCGLDAIAAITSMKPSEGFWYDADLRHISAQTGKSRVLLKPRDQLGCVSASADGRYVAVVHAICSDRLIVAGDLVLIDLENGEAVHRPAIGFDVSHVEWRSPKRVLLAGHSGPETVISLYDASSQGEQRVWASDERTTNGRYATVSGIGSEGDCVIVAESFFSAPEIARINDGKYCSVRALQADCDARMNVRAQAKHVSWQSVDGSQIDGWLLQPAGAGPFPLVMDIHGGPILHWRPRWLGRSGQITLMLLRRGVAIFMPNPRGSVGRGQEFARSIVGDLGGIDASDLLTGLDYLVSEGIADKKRIGVTGISYGGYMSAWLATQDTRFRAAVPVAPMTNYVTHHLLSNIPQFVAKFLEDDFHDTGGLYYSRSPIMFVDNVEVPTLLICGALDRCTPSEEAIQFYNALTERDVESALVIYPEEGHGIRALPAAIDYTARVVSWFETHILMGDVS